LIAERSIEDLVEPCRKELTNAGVETIYYDRNLLESLKDRRPIPISRNSSIQSGDLRSLIYTSGTTGLPKGVMMLCGRYLNTARSVATYLKLKPGDKFYTCLPLYHGAAQGGPLYDSSHLCRCSDDTWTKVQPPNFLARSFCERSEQTTICWGIMSVFDKRTTAPVRTKAQGL